MNGGKRLYSRQLIQYFRMSASRPTRERRKRIEVMLGDWVLRFGTIWPPCRAGTQMIGRHPAGDGDETYCYSPHSQRRRNNNPRPKGTNTLTNHLLLLLKRPPDLGLNHKGRLPLLLGTEIVSALGKGKKSRRGESDGADCVFQRADIVGWVTEEDGYCLLTRG
jgi:hypothetical protein